MLVASAASFLLEPQALENTATLSARASGSSGTFHSALCSSHSFGTKVENQATQVRKSRTR